MVRYRSLTGSGGKQWYEVFTDCLALFCECDWCAAEERLFASQNEDELKKSWSQISQMIVNEMLWSGGSAQLWRLKTVRQCFGWPQNICTDLQSLLFPTGLFAAHGNIRASEKLERNVKRTKLIKQTWGKKQACGNMSVKSKFWRKTMRLCGHGSVFLFYATLLRRLTMLCILPQFTEEV